MPQLHLPTSYSEALLPMANNRIRLISYSVMVYMILAFSWWTLLLLTKNRDAFQARRELIINSYRMPGGNSTDTALEHNTAYLELEKKYRRQEYMIFGEALVFVATLFAGLWFIHQSYSREASANQQRRNFLLSITHELKSPISAIRLVLETLLKRSLPKEKADHFLKSALKENERLYELVENLLLSAKLETAYQPLMEAVDLTSLVRELLSKAADRHPEASLAFRQVSPLPPLMGDQSGLTSMVTNLLENAIKYADGKPSITVSLEGSANTAILSVADQGPGIPDAEKKRIFEKFYRIGSEETRRAKGTGLGLFIVDQIVKAHGGHIQVLNNQPQGTVFRIEIPVLR
jgi:signal transduction histidine kinase